MTTAMTSRAGRKRPRKSKQAKDTHWPPSEEEWRDYLRDLPAEGWSATRTWVEKGVCEHAGNAERDQVQHSAREKVAKQFEQIRTKLTTKLPESIDGLTPITPDEFEAVRNHLKAAAQNLSPEQLNTASFLPSNRRERLYARFIMAWLAGGGDFAISTGPLARFLSAILDHVPDERPIIEYGAKAVLTRFARRVLEAGLSTQAKLEIDDSKIFVIDPDGKPRP
jgi:hypothetical protein